MKKRKPELPTTSPLGDTATLQITRCSQVTDLSDAQRWERRRRHVASVMAATGGHTRVSDSGSW